MLDELHFVTGNKDKLSEVQAMLGDAIKVRSSAIDMIEIQGSIEDIAKAKCRQAAFELNGPVLTEDTALCFHALKMLPGPYIKWFLQDLGHAGLNKLIDTHEDKSAEAVCTFAYAKGPGKEPLIFQGRVQGKIVDARGAPGFGWDPIFEYEGKTFAEMDKSDKNQISHRAIALREVRKWLETESDGGEA